MKTIKENFKKNGCEYCLLKRVRNVAIYEQYFNGDFVGYEVHKIKQGKEFEVSGVKIPASEMLASNNAFGKDGFFYRTFADAEKKSFEINLKEIEKAKKEEG